MTNAACANFPRRMPGLGLLYTVNVDPYRPDCLWVNADGGAAQIQNFDAYSAGACGQGAIRVLASASVVDTAVCRPTDYQSLQVTEPAPGTYASGNVSFVDSDNSPIAGAASRSIDATGSISLSGLPLNSGAGLPQFLITLTGTQGTPRSVTVKITWTATDDPSCLKPGTTTTGPAKVRYVALGDSVPYGHGLANPTKDPKDGLAANQPPSTSAWPSVVQSLVPVLGTLHYRKTGCDLVAKSGAPYDQLAVSGAPSIDNKWTVKDRDCVYPKGRAVPQHKAVFLDEVTAASMRANPPGVVTAPHAHIFVVGYYQIVPAANADLAGSSAACRDIRASRKGGSWRRSIRDKADFLQSQLNGTIESVAHARSAQFVDLTYSFSGHEMCTKDTWLYSGLWNAAHPTAEGQRRIGHIVANNINLSLGVDNSGIG